MKRLLLLFACAIIVFQAGSQSIPNSGFENWVPNPGYEDPQGWGTLNLLTAFGNPVSVSKDSVSPYAGSYSMKVETIVLTNNPSPADLKDTFGTAFTGNVSFAGQVLGFAYANRPANLTFYYKYAPNNNDSAYAFVLLSKWNNANSKRDTIGFGLFNISGTVSSYTLASLTINYSGQFAGVAPDTAMINFSPCADINPQPGSALYVDELSFSGGNVGIAEVKEALVALYPNPAVNELNITVSNETYNSVNIHDVNGKLLSSTPLVNKSAQIALTGFESGTYFYQITDNNNTLVKTGTFAIAK